MRALLAPDRALALALAAARRLQPHSPACALPAPSTHIRVGIFGTALTALALMAGGDPGPAQATLTFNVNATVDVEDPLLSDNNCDIDLPGPGPLCTLRAAISQSNFTDGLQIINVPAGTYNLTLANSLRISDEVTINGAGAEVVFVDASTIDNRVFWNLASAVQISGMTIRNGTAPVTFLSGGGIRNTGELTLIDLDVRNNTAEDGGGIYNESTLTIVDSVIRDNSSEDEGAGIMNGAFGNLSITDSVLSGNDARDSFGGGIENLGEASVSGTTFTDNTAAYGGAIGNNEGHLTMTSSTLSGNLADASGGGIVNYQGVLTITNSSIDANTAALVGGGIVHWEGEITLTGSTVNDNTADDGGGIYNEGGPGSMGVATLSGTTVDGNTSAQGSGGGIWNNALGEIALIGHTVISNNVSSESGGGIRNDGTFTMDDSELNDNSAGGRGGGIFNTSSAALDDVTVEGNTAEAAGGIDNYDDDSVLTVTRSTITGNASESQGGGVVNKATATISDSTISENTASDAGGGIFSIDHLTLERALVSHNTSESRGGGIATYAGNLSVNESLIYYNVAQDGGGVLNCADGVISNSTVSGNGAHGAGGILIGRSELACPYTLTLNHVTVTSNVSAVGGDGLDVDDTSGGTAILKNTILAGSNGTGSECEGASGITSGGHNLDDDDSCGLTSPGDLPGTDPLLGDFAYNGGPTQTHALLPGSPAIDAGHPDCPPPATDQRGFVRPLDGDLDGEARCDIGAYEAAEGTTPTPTPSPTPTSTPTATPSPTPTPTSTGPAGLAGDANCDEDVDAVDALWVLRYVAGMEPFANCINAANVKCDDAITSVDALFVLRHVVELAVNLPPGCAPIGE